MGDPAMELTQSQLQQIADYVKSQIPEWVYRSEPPNRELTERMLTVQELIRGQGDRMLAIEQELKAQRELMAARFEAVDRRFEAVDQRFESMQLQMDKRFESVDKRFESVQLQMDKRFESMDKRFESVDKQFGLLRWMWGGGVVLITLLISLYQFFG